MGPESVADLVAVLYRRKLTLLLVIVGALGGAAMFLDMIPRTYRSVASVFIQGRPTQLSLTSTAVNIPSGPIVPDVRQETSVGVIGVAATGLVHERVAELVPGIDPRTLKRNLILDIDRFKQLNVTAYDSRAERAVALANAGVKALQEVLQEMAERVPRANLELFQQRRAVALARYQEAVNRKLAYLDGLDTPDLDRSISLLFQDKTRYEAQLESLEREERLREVERPVIQGILEERPEFEMTTQSLSRNSVYSGLINRIADLESELAVLGLTLQPEHPEVEAVVERIAVARAQAGQELEMILSGSTLRLDETARDLQSKLIDYQVDEASLSVRKGLFEELLEEAERELAAVPVDRMELGSLDDEIRRTKRTVDDLQDRIFELELQLERGLDFTWGGPGWEATREKAKQVPGRSGVFIFAAISGIILGVLLSLFLELTAQLARRRPF